MSTMCCCCAPAHLLDWNGDLTDHGFSLPDVRETYEVWGPCDACDHSGAMSGPEECDECYGHNEVATGIIKISIVRKWDQCDCGSGEMVITSCPWLISGPGFEGTFPQSVNTRAVVLAIWPTAREPEPDYAWASEAGLRKAEGWG